MSCAFPISSPTVVEQHPIDMLLFCPDCGMQHIDGADTRPRAGDLDPWDNPPHRSHLCHQCGCIWRPADVCTNGVAEIATRGKADTWRADGSFISLPVVPASMSTFIDALLDRMQDGDINEQCENSDWRQLYLQATAIRARLSDVNGEPQELARMRHERDSWRAEAEEMSRQRRMAMVDVDLRAQHQARDVWYFQGDGNDHIESMGRRMVVVIYAGDLLALLSSARSNNPGATT